MQGIYKVGLRAHQVPGLDEAWSDQGKANVSLSLHFPSGQDGGWTIKVLPEPLLMSLEFLAQLLPAWTVVALPEPGLTPARLRVWYSALLSIKRKRMSAAPSWETGRDPLLAALSSWKNLVVKQGHYLPSWGRKEIRLKAEANSHFLATLKRTPLIVTRCANILKNWRPDILWKSPKDEWRKTWQTKY